MSINPPYRADVVGSYLRTDAIHEAREANEEGRLSDAELHAVEDREILDLIGKQRDNGLQLVTDGEFRRAWWHYDFYDGLENVAVVDSDHGIQFQGVQTKTKVLRVTGRIAFPADHPFLDAARFVVANAGDATPKVTIPSPTVLHFRLEPGALDGSPYSTPEDVFEDLAIAYQDAIKAFYAIGVRYLQFDDTAWAYLCSDVELEKARARGLDTEGLAERYSALLNKALEAKPADLTITTHVCRGNFRSTWIASGGYEPVAKHLLADTNYDGYFLEYDTDRAGGFEPLRFLPAGDKTVVLGLITSKSGDLETVADIKARIGEAAEFAPLAQLALSPQCGFASTEEGNILTEDQQWAKIREIVAISRDVWGD
ncbi:MAG TPA: 5-methyltetrahydropteroyltriglutamate--homocysteine S-methyltransferase [Microbacteriaceae bacterium]|nr:5-methyltetrahydropteroyltriglutamate--homocysteine S-methyltransferase [Microbacteriaceae bacterium]